jgi:hypothetical protein
MMDRPLARPRCPNRCAWAAENTSPKWGASLDGRRNATYVDWKVLGGAPTTLRIFDPLRQTDIEEGPRVDVTRLGLGCGTTGKVVL